MCASQRRCCFCCVYVCIKCVPLIHLHLLKKDEQRENIEDIEKKKADAGWTKLCQTINERYTNAYTVQQHIKICVSLKSKIYDSIKKWNFFLSSSSSFAFFFSVCMSLCMCVFFIVVITCPIGRRTKSQNVTTTTTPTVANGIGKTVRTISRWNETWDLTKITCIRIWRMCGHAPIDLYPSPFRSRSRFMCQRRTHKSNWQLYTITTRWLNCASDTLTYIHLFTHSRTLKVRWQSKIMHITYYIWTTHFVITTISHPSKRTCRCTCSCTSYTVQLYTHGMGNFFEIKFVNLRLELTFSGFYYLFLFVVQRWCRISLLSDKHSALIPIISIFYSRHFLPVNLLSFTFGVKLLWSDRTKWNTVEQPMEWIEWCVFARARTAQCI